MLEIKKVLVDIEEHYNLTLCVASLLKVILKEEAFLYEYFQYISGINIKKEC